MNIYSKVLPLVALALMPSFSSFSALPPVRGEKAVFEISSAVAVANPPRFGINIEPPAMSHWSTEPWHNQWWKAPNPNPITARTKGTATGGSATTLENATNPRIGFFDVFRTGFFDGGTAAVYRLENGRVSLVREGKIATFEASKEGPNRITFAKSGPEVKAGDEYVLTTSRTDFPSTVTRGMSENPWWLVGGFLLGAPGMTEKTLYEAGVRAALVKDAPPKGGGASFSITLPADWANKRVSVGNCLLSNSQPDWPRFHEGKTYTAHMWLKQTGMATGAVDVQIASMAKASFKVTGTWCEYTADFVAAPPKTTTELFDIGTTEPGTLYIDNVTIIEKDGPPPYGFYPAVVDTLKRFNPGSLRLWVLQENRGFGKCLDDALGDPAESNLTFRESDGAKTTTPVGLHQQLELCAQVGTEPWIITSTMFSAQEQKNLIEYLAGPADSPYGKKRAAWGRVKPWTDTFHKIKIEMGNETWNGMFAPQGFSNRGEFYGAYSEFMFQQMKSSPSFKPDKFQFVINGWVAATNNGKWSYSANALKAAPSAQGMDIAYYTGGWDSVGVMKAENMDESWMNALTFSRRMLFPRSREFKETVDAIAASRGRPGTVQALVYEAGPGYTLPGPGKLNMKEQEEGKSLAHAINCLDNFMSNLRLGYGDQSFFTFKNGHYWASHNRQWGEHVAWKALGMRNALLQGDLATAVTKQMVSLDLPETKADVVSQSNSADKKVKKFPAIPNLPLIDCYPFQDGRHHSVMLISRRLSGATKTTLYLPYEPQSKYTIHTLGAESPAANNINEEVVKVVTREKEGMTRSFTLDVPPHSVVVIVNEAR